MISISDVYAGYGGGDVLQGLDLEVETGSVTCIVGPNGAGKSTVLRTISGLLVPRKGSVSLRGRRISGLRTSEIVRAGVVQVPQQSALVPSMTVQENVLLGGFVRRRQRAALRRRLAELTAMFPVLAERGSTLAGNLSGGQRRMVEFARALMPEPQILLLDEPSLGLDPRALEDVRAAVESMREAGLTMLIVEQNVRFGLGIATRGVVMESGRVLVTKPADELLANPEMGALFFGGAVTTAAGGSQ
jgi:branched-chain amino acid transport system ATP-binding protein